MCSLPRDARVSEGPAGGGVRQGDLLLWERDLSSGWFGFVHSGKKMTEVLTPFVLRLLEELGSGCVSPWVFRGAVRVLEACGRVQPGPTGSFQRGLAGDFKHFSFKCLSSI